MKKKLNYKVGDKGRIIFLYPCWISEIIPQSEAYEGKITIRDSKENIRSMPVWQFEKHWEPDND